MADLNSSQMRGFTMIEKGIQILAHIAVILGILFGAFQVITMKRDQYNSTLIKFHEYWMDSRLEESRTFLRDKKDFIDHTLSIVLPGNILKTGEDLEIHMALRRMCDFYELMGWAVNRNYIKAADIICLYGFTISHYWKNSKNAIQYLRDKYKEDSIYDQFELLADIVYKSNSMKKSRLE